MNINGPDSQWAKLFEEGERKQKLAGWLDQVTSQLKITDIGCSYNHLKYSRRYYCGLTLKQQNKFKYRPGHTGTPSLFDVLDCLHEEVVRM